MTRRAQIILAASAALFLAAFTVAQATDTAPLIPTTTTAPYGAEIARETSCNTLRSIYSPAYNVWRGSVKRGREQFDQLAEMRAILRRIGWLERHGWCGG